MSSRDNRLHILSEQEDNLPSAQQVNTFSQTGFITGRKNVALITVSLFTHFGRIFARIPLRKNLPAHTYSLAVNTLCSLRRRHFFTCSTTSSASVNF